MTSRTSEDLVPKGLPYGERQKTVAAMRAADAPLASEASGGSIAPSSVAASPAAAAPTGPVSRQDLSNFDVFQNREPTEGFQANPNLDPVALFQARVAESPNTALQYYFGRYQDFLE